MTKRTLWLLACVVLVAAQLGFLVKARHLVPVIGAWVYDQALAGTGPSVPVDTAQLSDSGPGSLVSAMTLPATMKRGDGENLEAARVVYRSTNGDDDKPTVVSGSVFIPKGEAPEGG